MQWFIISLLSGEMLSGHSWAIASSRTTLSRNSCLIKILPGHGRGKAAPESQERRPWCYSRVHQVQTAAQTGKTWAESSLLLQILSQARQGRGPDSCLVNQNVILAICFNILSYDDVAIMLICFAQEKSSLHSLALCVTINLDSVTFKKVFVRYLIITAMIIIARNDISAA